MFSLPIVELAKAHGMTAEAVGSLDQARAKLAEASITHVLLNMHLATPEFLREMPSQTRVAAYGPHVEGARFLEFRKLGIRDVWPNSKLREKLPEWLSR